MKTVNIQCADIWRLLPEKYIYMAQDADGCIYAYTDKPVIKEDADMWDSTPGSSILVTGVNDPNPDWTYTLQQRPA
jgi:hypothetical protein